MISSKKVGSQIWVLACRFDYARLEGLAVSFLCSNLVDIRRAAMDVLYNIRQLHGQMLAAGAKRPPLTPATPLSPSHSPGATPLHYIVAIVPGKSVL